MTEEDLLYSRPTDLSGPEDFFFGYIDQLTGGAWGSLIIVSVFSLVYLNLNQFNQRESFAAASFAAMVTTVVLIPLGLAGRFHFIASVMAVLLAVIINGSGGKPTV